MLRIRVVEILDKQGLTVGEFAERAGLNYNTALALINERYKRIGLDTLEKICDGLGVTPGEVFEYYPDSHS